jgi:hypothetical protein
LHPLHIPPVWTTCLTNPILFVLIALITFYEATKR